MEAFLDNVVNAHSGKGSWLATWRLLVQDAWFQEQLDQSSRRVIRHQAAPLQMLEDVKQQAMLLLARDLHHAPDLHVDHQRVRKHFPGWLSTIIGRDCRQAIRFLRRLHFSEQSSIEFDKAHDSSSELDFRIDLNLAVDRLEEPERTIVQLHLKNMPIKEIAEMLALSYWKAHRALRSGLAVVQSRLSAP
jgi:RNA polymerase sigma factor (sigma-70 family)